MSLSRSTGPRQRDSTCLARYPSALSAIFVGRLCRGRATKYAVQSTKIAEKASDKGPFLIATLNTYARQAPPSQPLPITPGAALE